ncbi:MAG: hypothetical protein Q8P82_01400 [bacterium]|nr:hypothetical protein [bacterium]
MGKVCIACGVDIETPKMAEEEDEKCEDCEVTESTESATPEETPEEEM